ncbi:hypothetical protein [Type-D symbiont of Plautia stali]|uniref:hypothetical protein n=1 Tax=Type-D symbiont of Plautia stali TaxID=1560356 RepID=UPI0034E2A90D
MFRSDAEEMAGKWFLTGTVATWLQQSHLGQDSWWDKVRTAGTPVIERDETGATTMHFFGAILRGIPHYRLPGVFISI